MALSSGTKSKLLASRMLCIDPCKSHHEDAPGFWSFLFITGGYTALVVYVTRYFEEGTKCVSQLMN